MGFYEHYANRSRNSLGIKIKKKQATKIFHLGLPGNNTQDISVLELGPGDGYIAHLSVENNFKYVAVEASEPVVKKLSSEGYNIIQSFVPPLPENIENIDICFMLHLIEHMKDMDSAAKLIKELKIRLNKGGKIVIACPDYIRWKHHFYDCDYTHQLPFTRRRLNQLLINEGFEITYDSIYTGTVFGYRGLLLFWLARIFFPQFIDDMTFRFFKTDVLKRGFLTIIPNLIVVAKKTD